MSAARDHWMHRTGGGLYSNAAFVDPADRADRSKDAARDEAFAVRRIELDVPPPPPEKRKHRRRMGMSLDMYVMAVEVRREESK